MSKLRSNKAKVEELEIVELEGAEVVEAKEQAQVEDITVIDNAVKNAESVVETVEEVKEEPKVRINPKQDLRTFIGDQWYNLKADKQVSVPRTVKEKLQKAGLLNPL